MARTKNRITLLGYTGMTPQVSDKRLFFTLATTECWRDRQGNLQEHTDWHSVVFFGSEKAVAFLAQRITKGQLVFVEGRMHSFRNADEITCWEVIANDMVPASPSASKAGDRDTR